MDASKINGLFEIFNMKEHNNIRFKDNSVFKKIPGEFFI
jgi:hypothetical protein